MGSAEDDADDDREGEAFDAPDADVSPSPVELALREGEAFDAPDADVSPSPVELALREAEHRFHAFMDENPAVAWMKDAGGRYVFVNETLLRTYGGQMKDVLGRTDHELLPARVADQLVKNDAEVIANEWPAESVEEIPSKEGELRSWRVVKFPFRDLSGALFVGGIALDITEQVRAERAMAASEERFRTLVESAQDAIFSLAIDGRVTTVNPAAERITGWRREDLVGMAFRSLIAPDDVERGEAIFARTLAGETLGSFELGVRHVSGHHVPVEFTVTPQRVGSRVVGVLGIGRDVKERHALEAQVRSMQKLESVGRLAAGIAHDFNNLLTVQQAYLGMVMEDPEVPGWVAEALEPVIRAGERAAELTSRLLAFSRKQVISPQTVNVGDLVREVVRLLGRVLGEDVELALDLPEGTASVLADPSMLEQVLVNLAVNARDAMERGGRLSISIHTTTLDEHSVDVNPEASSGRFVVLTVSDTGVGIPPDDMPRLFEPFFTTKPRGKGTGLGLPMVHGIVKQHGGWIEVESAVGVGSTFRIFLPALDSSPEAARPRSSRPQARRGDETILLVEDEDAVREVVGLVLERAGYRVLVASSGAEALRLWDEHRHEVDMVLTDMVMPGGVSGGQLAERLLAERPDLRIMVASGYSPEHIPTGERVRFLPKPFVAKTLVREVRELLDRG
ncbi:MAG: PAS domain S-box protein [Myxococcales bacterium]|nr:PAS domain S-box protein [Myxococcales bacterium]